MLNSGTWGKYKQPYLCSRSKEFSPQEKKIYTITYPTFENRKQVLRKEIERSAPSIMDWETNIGKNQLRVEETEEQKRKPLIICSANVYTPETVM